MNAPMFNPTRDQARRFFLDAWRKQQERLPMTELEIKAGAIVGQHPEYHAVFADADAALARDWGVADGEANPFLHLSLHLAIEEQLAIDQPTGIRAAISALQARLGDPHAATHRALECLGEALWRAQRDRTPLDGNAYVDCIRRNTP
jgi:hypothetical protein